MKAYNKAEIPLLMLLLPFIAGLAIAVIFTGSMHVLLLQVILGVLVSAFIVLNITYRKLNMYKARWIGGVLINACMLVAGMLCIEAHRDTNFSDHFSAKRADSLCVHISSEPKLNDNNVRFTVVVDSSDYRGKTYLQKGNLMATVRVDSASKNKFAYGDALLIPANYTDVEGPANPAEFNYKAYLSHQNIYQQCFLIQSQVVFIKHHAGNAVIAQALAIRRHLVDKLGANIRDTDALAVASTIILGYRADLRKDVQEAYSKTGTMHLLSVSGMHVGWIYLLVSFILAFLPPRKYARLVKAIITIAVIWTYAVITGFSPAVCRAAMMLTMFIVGFAFNRHINRLNLLALSAFIFLLYNPFLITDAGFQLSYLAVFGIIILQPIVYKWVTVKNKLGMRLWMVCSVSIAAQFSLFPVSTFYFHDFPVSFLASNLFVLIPAAIVMFGGIVYLALPNIPVVSAGLAKLIESTVIIMTRTLSAIEHAPLGSIDKIWLSYMESVLFYGLLISFIYAMVAKNKQALKLSVMFTMLIAISIGVKRNRALTTKEATFFSLRKNSGILFRDGEQGVLLSDMAIADKNYQYSVQPYLDSCKVTHVRNVGFEDPVNCGYLCKKQNLVQFGDKTMLILDKASANKIFAGKLNLDYIYITGSPIIDMTYLTQNYNFKTLIVDGHNSNKLIAKLETEAKQQKIDLRNLKRNNALVIASNN